MPVVRTMLAWNSLQISSSYCKTYWNQVAFIKGCVHVSEQWKNLKGYFFKFLIKEKTFKQSIAPTSRYQWLKAVSVSDLTKHYIAFSAFITQNFEALLVLSQSKQAMIHFFLYPCLIWFQILWLNLWRRKLYQIIISK